VPVIGARHLVKQFRTGRRPQGVWGGLRGLLGRDTEIVRALDDVSFDVEEGECVGYIGQNGAGKSTTIKLLTGVLLPDGGQVEVAGLVPSRQRERNALNIGVVFGQRTQLWWDLPLIDSFELIGQMYRLPRATYRRNLDQFVDLLDMQTPAGAHGRRGDRRSHAQVRGR
jgi:ABC-2 type transport system ATP-binding protein